MLEIGILLKPNSKLEEDHYKKTHVEKKTLKVELLEEGVLLISERSDIIDHFISDYRKEVLYVLVKGPTEVLEKGKYPKAKLKDWYEIPYTKGVSKFCSRLKKVLNHEAFKGLTLNESSNKELVEVLKETTQEVNLDQKKALDQNLKDVFILKTDFPGDFLYTSDYKALDKTLDDIYQKVVLKKDHDHYYFPHVAKVDDLMLTNHAFTFLREMYYPVVPRGQFQDVMLRAYLEDYLDTQALLSRITGLHYTLNFSACNCLWPALRNKDFDTFKTFYQNEVTSFRNEQSKASSLERLEVFKRHEIVFLGTEKEIVNHHKLLYKRILAFFSLLNLYPMVLRTSPWDNSDLDKTKYTLDFELKIKGKNLELGNLSLSGSIWTDAFKVTRANKRAYSGCTGIGKERLIYGFLLVNGLDPKNWPIKVMKIYDKYKTKFTKR